MGEPGGGAPRKVGQFELQERLATAPEGELFKAHQPVLGRTVALWLIAPELSADETYKKRFLDQAKKAPKLNCENATRLLDVGRCAETQRYFAVCELAEGLALPTLLERRGGKLERAEALEICAGVCNALAAAEALGIVHGDIRLEYVVLDSARTPKLLHLGLAKHGSRVEARAYAPSHRPQREAFEVANDLYSVGVCLSLLATGCGVSAFDPARAAHGLDDDVAALVYTLLADDPASRFASAAEAAEAIRAALATQVVRPRPQPQAAGATDIEATMLTPATKRKLTPKPDERVKRSASGRIIRGGGFYGTPVTGESLLAGTSAPVIPQLSLDDPKAFLRGWETHVRDKTGAPEASADKAAVRRDHYFHKITSTMEKVPASFLLTMGPGQGGEGAETKAPRMLLSDDGERAYKVARKLGQGGQGTVYKVDVQGEQAFPGFSKPVTSAALKVSHDADALLSEQAIYSIPNPGIIKLLDAGQIQGSQRKTSYLVLERLYPHPFNLFSRDGERSQVDVATAVDTYVNILLTVHELHYRKQLPLVLCDIKPDNMMVRMSGEAGTPRLKEYLRRLAAGAYEPVLLDMGCAQHHGELRKARGRMNVIIGTPLYMSPEAAPTIEDGQYVPGVYNAKQDVYALTLTFLYHLTGVRPYTHTGLYQVDPDQLFNELLSFKRDQVDPIDYDLLEQRVGVEHMEDFVEILQKGLHPDPDYRATAKVLFKLCEKKFRLKETRVRDLSTYYYDDIKGLCLAQDRFPRIRPDYNLYLNPDVEELTGPPRQRTRRISRSGLGLPRGQTSSHRRPSESGRIPRPSESGRIPRPSRTGRHARPASESGRLSPAEERQRTGRFRRNSGSFKRPGQG
jgi:serine/threonine-protein kinase